MTSPWPKKKTIKGTPYEFYALDPEKSVAMLVRLTKLFGESMVRLWAGAQAPQADGTPVSGIEGVGHEVLVKAVTSLSQRLDEKEVVSTIKEMLETAHLQRKGDNGPRKLSFTKDYTGHLAEMLFAFKGAIEAEYGDFFGELLG